MLNFKFPYEDPEIDRLYAAAAIALANAIESRGKSGFAGAVDRFRTAHRAFANRAGGREWRYFDFELWQEGTARWTELRLGTNYPEPAVRRGAVRAREQLLAGLRRPALAQQGRLAVYAYGAGELMLIDMCDTSWRKRYLRNLSLDPLMDAAWQRCSGRGPGR